MKRSICIARRLGSIYPSALAAIAAAAVTLAGSPAQAGGCPCQQPREYPGAAICECESGWGHREAKPGPIYKTLDAFAGGIEKLLRLDSSSSDTVCDDACDAAMIDDLSQPPRHPATAHPHHHRAQPGYRAPHSHRHVSPHGAPAVPGGATDRLQMSSPNIQTLPNPSIPERGELRRQPSYGRTPGGRPAETSPQRRGNSTSPSNGSERSGSGDASSDPFADDSVLVDPRGGKFVRPSNYETGRAPRVSSRRLNSAR